MLAFDDAALAHLVIAASRIPPEQRRQWLADVAARLEGRQPRSATTTARQPRSRKAANQAEHRRRRRSGEASVRLWVQRDLILNALIDSKC